VELKHTLTLLILLTAVFSDLSTGKISNKLIGAGYLTGFIYHIHESGLKGSIFFLIDILFPIILLFFLFQIRALGAGDIKLLSVISGIWSIRIAILCIVSSFVVGAAISLCKLLYYQNLVPHLIFFFTYMKELITNRVLKEYSFCSEKNQHYIHFSIPILIGYLIILEVVH